MRLHAFFPPYPMHIAGLSSTCIVSINFTLEHLKLLISSRLAKSDRCLRLVSPSSHSHEATLTFPHAIVCRYRSIVLLLLWTTFHSPLLLAQWQCRLVSELPFRFTQTSVSTLPLRKAHVSGKVAAGDESYHEVLCGAEIIFVFSNIEASDERS